MGYLDYIGVYMVSFVIALFKVCPLSFCIGCFLKLDPLYDIILLLPLESLSNIVNVKFLRWILLFLRLIIFTFVVGEICRIFSGSCIYLAAFVMLHLKIYGALFSFIIRNSIVNTEKIITYRYAKVIECYNTISIIHCIMKQTVEWASFAALLFCMIVIVMSNFLTIKMYAYLPFVFYLCLPCVSVIIWMTLLFLIPPVIFAQKESANLLHIMKANIMILPLQNRRWFYKRIVVIRAYTHHAGLSQFAIVTYKPSMRNKCYWNIVSYTINALLLIPVSESFVTFV